MEIGIIILLAIGAITYPIISLFLNYTETGRKLMDDLLNRRI